jgi:hypothetical protein
VLQWSNPQIRNAIFLYSSKLKVTLSEEHRLRVLKRMFAFKREEMTGGSTRLHNKALHNLYASPNIIRVIKWRRIRWAANVARG